MTPIISSNSNTAEMMTVKLVLEFPSCSCQVFRGAPILQIYFFMIVILGINFFIDYQIMAQIYKIMLLPQ
jgi:hypothetical protein